jgi:PAS domain S-box-containing protein
VREQRRDTGDASVKLTDEFSSGDALFAFDDELEILSWNEAAEQLTGLSAQEAVGRPCWQVLVGVDERWASVCHAGCSAARLAGAGRPVPEQRLLVRGRRRRRFLSLSTITVRGGAKPVFLHLMKGASAPEGPKGEDSLLMPREREILELLAEGVPAKVIASQLEVAEATVRNHIRAVLRKLDSTTDRSR